jgi:DNA-binding transcriptional MerR regulator
MHGKNAKQKSKADAKGRKEYKPEDVERMEKLAMEKANAAISAIESAIAAWEASDKKEEGLEERIMHLRAFYDAISSWMKKALKTAGKEDKIEERVERLKEYIEICYTYGQ